MNNICIAKRRTLLHVLNYFPSLNRKYVGFILRRCYAVSVAKEFSKLINNFTNRHRVTFKKNWILKYIAVVSLNLENK